MLVWPLPSTQTTLPIFDEPRSIAHRRFSHFVWLMRRLGTRLAAPPPLTTLPHSLDAVERQRKTLQVLYHSLACYPCLSSSKQHAMEQGGLDLIKLL